MTPYNQILQLHNDGKNNAEIVRLIGNVSRKTVITVLQLAEKYSFVYPPSKPMTDTEIHRFLHPKLAGLLNSVLEDIRQDKEKFIGQNIFVIVNHMRHDAVEREVETFAKKWYLPKEDVQYEVYNYRDGMLANENKLKDAIDYASYKDSSPNPISKLKFRKMMIEEFKDILIPEVYPLLH